MRKGKLGQGFTRNRLANVNQSALHPLLRTVVRVSSNQFQPPAPFNSGPEHFYRVKDRRGRRKEQWLSTLGLQELQDVSRMVRSMVVQYNHRTLQVVLSGHGFKEAQHVLGISGLTNAKEELAIGQSTQNRSVLARALWHLQAKRLFWLPYSGQPFPHVR